MLAEEKAYVEVINPKDSEIVTYCFIFTQI